VTAKEQLMTEEEKIEYSKKKELNDSK